MAVEADDDSHIINVAGGAAVGGTAGVDASTVVMVYDKTVEAILGMSLNASGETVVDAIELVRATGDVTVSAVSDDDILVLALNFSGGGTAGVAVGASALVFENDVMAGMGGKV